ncbi:MAG: c-type cytochrome [Candidatus Acidiferrales bacterium]
MQKSTVPQSVGFLERAALRHPLRVHILALLAMILIAAIIALAFAVLIFVRPSAAAESKAPARQGEHASVGNAQHGKKLFTSYGCYECHGLAAQGGIGPRLGPDPLPLSFIEKYVRHPTGSMPPYTAKVVSDHDLADIHAYLKTLPEPPKEKDIPLLNE